MKKVIMMKFGHIVPIALLTLFCTAGNAGEKVLIGTPLSKSPAGKQDKKWYYPSEIVELKIKQSNDGTGIIKDMSCSGCDYSFVKITRDTKVIVNGKETSLLRARERAGLPVFIEFDKQSAEVKHIYWAE